MTISTNSLNAIIAYNQPGRVGASSIYTATVADRMAETSQTTAAQYLRCRRVAPSAIIDINLNRIDPDYEVYTACRY